MTCSRTLLLLTLVFAASTADAACMIDPTPEAHQGLGSNYELSYRTVPTQINVSEPFTVIVHICENTGKPFTGSLDVDAHMPLHKHGMNYRPKISKRDDGTFQAEIFLFHMPGQWQFKFDIEGDKGRERITLDQIIK